VNIYCQIARDCEIKGRATIFGLRKLEITTELMVNEEGADSFVAIPDTFVLTPERSQ
jgi:hypothetical protein